MNKSKFDEIVANKANQLVNDQMSIFARSVTTAIEVLAKNLGLGCVSAEAYVRSEGVSVGGYAPKVIQSILLTLARDPGNRFPRKLWDAAREKVAKEILATMDVVQQALAAPPPSETDVFKPEEPTDGKIR